MSKVCPVCNDLKKFDYSCSKCGSLMINKGRVQEYMDSYGSEEPLDDSENYCFHVYECRECGNFCRKAIKKLKI
ncbi:hypothetical protein [Clostridium rectalis]|uniref:hypothetical protein n=1 Tax=Clostridium rectalis TaxID=2040295 RepID=UPI000F63CA15|nr:hypothetical protein [Clostridium rectalis]